MFLFTEWVKNKPFFDYSGLGKDRWRECLNKAKHQFSIYFDTENDDSVAQREITIDQDYWKHTHCKFRCELRRACGDWQEPIYYFRCQLIKGYAYGVNSYTDSNFFCVIPDKTHGNSNLEKTKNGYSAPEHGKTKAKKDTNDEQKCWQFVKEYLKHLVDKEIAHIKSNQ